MWGTGGERPRIRGGRVGRALPLATELRLYPLAIFIGVLNSEQLVNRCLLTWDGLHFCCMCFFSSHHVLPSKPKRKATQRRDILLGVQICFSCSNAWTTIGTELEGFLWHV